MPDPNRFDALVLPHLDAAYNLARWLTRDAHDAEDVVQDACVRALKYMGSLEGGDARGWFLKIVRNAFYDWLGRNRPAEIVHDENETVDAAVDVAAVDARAGGDAQGGAADAGGCGGRIAAAIPRSADPAGARGAVVQGDRARSPTYRSARSCRGWRAPATLLQRSPLLYAIGGQVTRSIR